MLICHPLSPRRACGVALVIVLAFVVLLTGLVLAFFSRAISDRQISNSSASGVRVDLFAQDAVATTMGDLRQEIVAGSVICTPTPAPSPAVYIYRPKAPVTAFPCPAGVSGTTLPNLLKRSANNTPFFTGTNYDTSNFTPSNRAAGPSLTQTSSLLPSLNGRAISPARWNKSLFLPKKDTSPANDTDFTPVGATPPRGNTPATWPLAPDWIVVARDGTNPAAWDPKLRVNGTDAAVGRYAYNIYDEGGVLDMNAAGYPPEASSLDSSVPQGRDPMYKPSLAFADLTQLPGLAPTAADAAGNTILGLSTDRANQVIRTLVGWRNYASSAIDLTGSSPTVGTPISGSVNNIPGYTWASGGGVGSNVLDYLNFLRFSNDGFLSPANRLVVNNQSDRSFASRQQLINLLLNSIADQTSSGVAERAALQNALQYLGTFSRSLNQPSYFPVSRAYDAINNPNPRPTILASSNTTDPTKGGGNNVGDPSAYPTGVAQDALSPNFLLVRAEAAFTRNDNVTTTVVGEPLVKTRFALQRLAWLTYMGPSSRRNIPTSNPGADTPDYDMWQLVNNYGISRDYLAQGTPANIQRYFGLEWDGSKWKYDLHNRNGTPAGTTTGATGAIRQIQEIADLKTREPDFFELLKASVDPGSLGKASISSSTADLTEGTAYGLAPLNFQFFRDVSYDAAIIQLGANIIDQFDADGYPTRIVFDDGSGRQAREFRGVENLPYIYRMRLGVLRAREPIPEGNAGNRNAGSTDYVNNGCTPDLHSGAVLPTSGYTPNPLKDTGVGILLAIPDLWNPHDQNSSLGSPRPGLNAGSFRVIASSVTPDGFASANPAYSSLTVGGSVVSSTNTGRYKGISYQPLGSGYGGAEPAGAVPPGAVAPYNAPVPLFSRTPTPNGTGGTSMTLGYNNPQIITSLPLPNLTPPVPVATSSILSFSIPNAAIFREPTLLAKPDTISGSGLTMAISNPDVTQLVGDNGPAWTGTGIRGGTLFPNPLGQPGATLPVNQPYIGLYLGAFPLRWVGSRWANSPYVAPSTTFWVYTDEYPAVLGGPAKSILYSLQCQDTSGNWVSYDEKYVNTDTPAQWVPSGLLLDGIVGTYTFADPRTSRFGAPDEEYRSVDSPHNHAPTSATWLDTTTDVITTERPDIHAGFGANFRGTYGTSVDWGNWAAAGWHFKNVYGGGANSMFVETGLLAQNNPNYGSDGIRDQGDPTGVGATDAQFYTDPDGVVRRGMAAFIASGATSAVGQPLATASGSFTNGKSGANASQSVSRPRVLNRPFRSVGELGYVFSGTPWKNLDFSTPESGYSELLDVFCVNETDDVNGMVAGKLDLNTRQTPVLTAALAGTLMTETTAAPTQIDTPPTGPVPNAAAVAKLLVTRTSSGAGTATTGPQPLANLGDLVGKWVSKKTLSSSSFTPPLYSSHNIDGSNSYDGFSTDIGAAASVTTPPTNPVYSQVEAQRETAVRALAAVGNTRVWNLMIDLIAQTGRYPTGATGLNNFLVEGEQRCWLHVAIDRCTGQVVDSKLETVKE